MPFQAWDLATVVNRVDTMSYWHCQFFNFPWEHTDVRFCPAGSLGPQYIAEMYVGLPESGLCSANAPYCIVELCQHMGVNK